MPVFPLSRHFYFRVMPGTRSKGPAPAVDRELPLTPRTLRKQAREKAAQVGKKSEEDVTSVKKEKRAKKTPNYSIEEDEALCRAYMNVSQDPIKGANQSSGDFWNTVQEKYDILVASVAQKRSEGKGSGNDSGDSVERNEPICYASRTASSLSNRWTKVIAIDCRKFNRFYKAAKTPEKSGWAEDDYIKQATVDWIHAHKDGKKFRFVHCWKILKTMPQFDPNFQEDTEVKRTVNEITSCQGSSLSRPVGAKKAKRSAAAAASAPPGVAAATKSSMLSEAADRMTAEFRRKRKLDTYKFRSKQALRLVEMFQRNGNAEKADKAMAQYEKLSAEYEDFLANDDDDNSRGGVMMSHATLSTSDGLGDIGSVPRNIGGELEDEDNIGINDGESEDDDSSSPNVTGIFDQQENN